MRHRKVMQSHRAGCVEPVSRESRLQASAPCCPRGLLISNPIIRSTTMIRTRRFVLVALGVALLTGHLWTQERPSGARIGVSAEVDRTTVPLNRTVRLTVDVVWQGELDHFEIKPPEPPELTNLEVVGSASSNQVGEHAGMPQAIRTYAYTLRPLELGMAYIEPVILGYRERGDSLFQTLQTGRLQLTVTDPVPEEGRTTIWFVAGFSVVVAAAGVGVWLWRRRRTKPTAQIPEVKPIEVQYLEELRERVQPQSPDLDNDFAEISRVLRRFLAECYDLPAKGASTAELVAALNRTPLTQSQVQQIEEVLTICDVAKFSGGHGSEPELLRAYTLVETLLQEHRQRPKGGSESEAAAERGALPEKEA